MLVRFHKREFADQLIKMRKQLANKGYAIFDDSTYLNRKLINQLNEHPAIDKAWLTRGHVWATDKASSTKTKYDILSHIDLPNTSSESQAENSLRSVVSTPIPRDSSTPHSPHSAMKLTNQDTQPMEPKRALFANHNNQDT